MNNAQAEEIVVAEIEVQRLCLEARDRYTDYLEAQEKVYRAELEVKKARGEGEKG